MTKRDIIEAMRDLDDDAEIHLMCFFEDECVGEYLYDVHFDDVVSGDGLQNEITLVGSL